jgi:alkylated DNA repair dioxygenase AlkB
MSPTIIIDEPGCRLTLWRKALHSDLLYYRLADEAKWQRSKYKMGAREVQARRDTCTYGDTSSGLTEFKYSGSTEVIHEWSDTSIGRSLRRRSHKISQLTGQDYNNAFLNYYRNGRESLGYHSDKANVSGGPERSVVSVSYMEDPTETRTFQVKKRGGSAINIEIGHGDILEMKGLDFQKLYKHGIPVRAGITTGRISVTYRVVV